MSNKYAELVKGTLSHRGNVDLTKYYIVGQEIIQSRESRVEVEVKLGRRLTNQMITNFLPTLIICIICYFTNFFKVG